MKRATACVGFAALTALDFVRQEPEGLTVWGVELLSGGSRQLRRPTASPCCAPAPPLLHRPGGSANAGCTGATYPGFPADLPPPGRAIRGIENMLDYTRAGRVPRPRRGRSVHRRGPARCRWTGSSSPGSFSAGPPMAPWPPPGGATGSAFSAAYTDTPPGTPSA